MTKPSRVRPIAPALLCLGLGLLPGCDSAPTSLGERASLKGHPGEVVAVAFAPDGLALVSRGGGVVKVWDLGGLRASASFTVSEAADFGSVAFAPDGRTLAATRPGIGVVTWDLATWTPREYRDPDRADGGSPPPDSHGWGLAYSPDGKTLAGGGSHLGRDGTVTLWDVATGQASDLGSSPSPVTSVAFAPDGKTVAAKDMSGTLSLWDLGSRAELDKIAAGRAYLAPACFAPDGKTVASAGDDRTVKAWDAATGDLAMTLKGHLKAVLGLAFHPGGRLLASSDAGGAILVWDLRSRRPIARLEGHQGKVWALAFSPDGKTLASGGEDRTVRLWDVPGSDDAR